MTVTIDITALAAELRLGDGVTAPTEPIAGILGRHLAAAIEVIQAHAPTGPDAVHDLAAIRLCGYWFDQPLATSNMSFANALVNSGAASALRDWRIPHSARLDGGE